MASLGRGPIAAGSAAGSLARTDRRPPGHRPVRTPGRVFVGTGPRPGALAHALPRPGVAICRACCASWPACSPGCRPALAGMNEAARDDARPGSPPTGSIRPRRSTMRVRQEREDALRDTRFAQPAIGAVSLGLLGILEDFGVRPDMVGGHSFGELTALRAAGRIDDALAGHAGPAPRRAHGRLRRRRARAPCSPSSPRSSRSPDVRPRACPGRGHRQQECPPAMRPVGPGRRDRAEPADPGRSRDHDPRRPGLGRLPQPVRRRAPRARSGESLDAGRICRARRSPSSPTRPPSPTPTTPGRPATCSPVSSPGRSSSSPRSRRCTGWGPGRSSRSAPTPGSPGSSASILEGRDHLAIAVDASRGIRRQRPRSGLLARNLGCAGVCC